MLNVHGRDYADACFQQCFDILKTLVVKTGRSISVGQLVDEDGGWLAF